MSCRAPHDYEAIQALLGVAGSAEPGLAAQNRKAFYQSQVYDVSPTTDDRPFFGHFFRWQQVPAILAQLGRTWQPFGGSGYLLVWALLLLALLAAVALVILPLRWAGRRPPQGPLLGHALLYFVALGLGYILVEMPLLQQFILYLGQPTLAFSAVITTLLLFSGLGSLLAPHLPLRPLLVVLIVAIVAYPLLLRPLLQGTMALGWGARLFIAVAALVPLGLLMGVPFVGGLRSVQGRAAGLDAVGLGCQRQRLGGGVYPGHYTGALLGISSGVGCGCCLLRCGMVCSDGAGSQVYGASPRVRGTKATSMTCSDVISSPWRSMTHRT